MFCTLNSNWKSLGVNDAHVRVYHQHPPGWEECPISSSRKSTFSSSLIHDSMLCFLIDCDCPKANRIRQKHSTNSFCDKKGECICPRSKMYLTPWGCVPSLLSKLTKFNYGGSNQHAVTRGRAFRTPRV